MYNKRYMKEEEVPQTTEELYSYMEENTKEAIMGLWSSIVRLITAQGWIHGFGGIS